MKFTSAEYYAECANARKCNTCEKVFTIFIRQKMQCISCARNVFPKTSEIVNVNHYKEVFFNGTRFSQQNNFRRVYFVGRKSGINKIPNEVYKYLEEQIINIKE